MNNMLQFERDSLHRQSFSKLLVMYFPAFLVAVKNWLCVRWHTGLI